MNIRTAAQNDAELLWRLAQKCPPLDVHTPYTYWVICTFFPECIFILENEGKPVGYSMNLYTRDAMFIWQIGILEEYRGKKLSRMLISRIGDCARDKGLEQMYVSIAPDNRRSFGAFSGYCREHGLRMEQAGQVVLDIPEKAWTETEDLWVIRNAKADGI